MHVIRRTWVPRGRFNQFNLHKFRRNRANYRRKGLIERDQHGQATIWIQTLHLIQEASEHDRKGRLINFAVIRTNIDND